MTNNIREIREIEQWYVPQDLEDKLKELNSSSENEKEENNIESNKV